MADKINWDELDKQYDNNFKQYLDTGTYSTKVESVEKVLSQQKSTPGIQFLFKDTDEGKFPKFGVTHWLSVDKPGFRQHHAKELLKVLGVSDSASKQAVQACEDKEGIDKIHEAYYQIFKKAVEKGTTVDVVIYYRNDNAQYPDCDFEDPTVRMGRPEKGSSNKGKGSDEVVPEDVPEGDIDLSDIPF